MKKIFIYLSFIIMLFSLVSCGEVIGTSESNPSSNSSPSESSSSTEKNVVTFKVNVMYNGIGYPGNGKLKVVLKGKNGTFEGILQNDGTVSIDALDGEYYAYLSGSISYAYDPNSCIINSSNPEGTINLYAKGKTTSGKGTDKFSTAYKIDNLTSVNTSSLFFYTATIKSASNIVYYEFIPKVAGVYKIESCVNMFENQVNPIAITYYAGSSNTAFGETKVDKGGASYDNGYTKNFAFTTSFTERQLGNVQKFGIRAEVKDSSIYPVEVPFKITYLGDAEQTYVNRTIMYASDIYYKRDSDGNYLYDSDGNHITEYEKISEGASDKFTNFKDDGAHNCSFFNKLIYGENFNGNNDYYYKRRYSYVNGTYELDSTGDYVLKPQISAPNVTHINVLADSPEMKSGTQTVLDMSKCFLNTESGIWYVKLNNGETRPIVANIGNPSKYIEESVIHLEDQGGKCYSSIATNNYTEDGQRIIENYKSFVEAEYYELANSDGYVYVTDELKNFLQKLSNANSYFFDGIGWCEADGTYAYEDSQWLFVCGYYD